MIDFFLRMIIGDPIIKKIINLDKGIRVDE